MPAVATIILNWNDSAATVRCGESVLRAFEQAGDQLTSQALCIVDNGSLEQHATALGNWCAAQKSSTVQFVANNSNLGFAAGMNAGIKRVGDQDPDYIWILNNDTEVAADAIFHLLAFSKQNRGTAITGVTVIDQATGLIETAGGYRYFPWIGYNQPIMAGARLEALCNVGNLLPDYVNGAAMWLKGDYVRRIGGLPTDHFLYFEELELNQYLKRGESIGWSRDALVFHQGGGSSTTAELQKTGTYHAALSAFTYTRHYRPWCLPTVILARVLGLSIRSTMRRQPGLLSAVFEALKDFVWPGKSSSS